MSKETKVRIDHPEKPKEEKIVLLRSIWL